MNETERKAALKKLKAWLVTHTQAEIGKALGYTQAYISLVSREVNDLTEEFRERLLKHAPKK